MHLYVLKRILAVVPVLLGLTVIVFLIMALIPGDSGHRHPGVVRDAGERGQAEPRPRPRPAAGPALPHLAGEPPAGGPRPLLQPRPAGARRGAGAVLRDAGPRGRGVRPVHALGAADRHLDGGPAVRLDRPDPHLRRADRHLRPLLLARAAADPALRGGSALAARQRHVRDSTAAGTCPISCAI